MNIYRNLPQDISSPIPWLIITGTFTKDDLRRYMDDFQSKGIREFFLYATFGLEYPDFLTEDWFEMVDFLLKECAGRDMQFWIYDELSWPSGSSGGRLPANHPEYCMRTMRCSTQTLAPDASWMPEKDAEYIWCGLRTAPGTEPVEIPADGSYCNQSSSDQEILCITKVLIDDKFFCSMGTVGTGNEAGIMDALNPDAVRCWMSYNYFPYAERFPQALGKTIRGFFFDEPTMVSPFHTGDIAWTPGLEEKFFERYHYSCRELYWSLFEPVYGYEQFRYDFWRLVGNLFAEAFSAQAAKWCSEHGLLFTGHSWPEEPSCQRLMTTAVGDIFYQQQYLHIPGTDFLFHENNFVETAGMCPGTPKWARNLLYSAKHPSSVARYNGAVYTICESSACLGDKCSSPSVQKIMYDFLYAMGLSLMNPGCAYDMTDFRKYVSAPDASLSYWPLYGKFVDYMRTMAGFNSRGRTHTQIAVLNPVSTKFAYSNIAPDTSIRQERSPLQPEGDCAEAMLETLETLVLNHRDFELIFEDVIAASPVGSDGTLRANESAFKVIILPHCYALDDAVWCKLNEFVRQGGHLIALGPVPQLPLKHGFEPLDTPPLQLHQVQMPAQDGGAELLTVLEKLLPAEYTLYGAGADRILTHLRNDQDHFALFAANGTAGDKTIKIDGPAAARLRQVIDLQNQQICRWDPERPVTFLEGDSFLFTSDAPPPDAPLFQAPNPETVLSLEQADWQVSQPVRNSMRIALKCEVNGEIFPLEDTGAGDVVLDPEDAADVLLLGSFTIEGEIPADLRIWFERDNFSDLTINGQSPAVSKREDFFIRNSTTVFIAEYCRQGENIVRVRIPRFKWMLERCGIRTHLSMLMKGTQPLILLGTFAAAENHTIRPLASQFNAGALEPRGFKHFTDILTLKTVFDLPEDTEIKNAKWQIAATELPLTMTLNGVDLGVKFWKNGNLNIPDGILKPSGNTVEMKLYGNLQLLLGRGWLGKTIEPVNFTLPVIKLIK